MLSSNVVHHIAPHCKEGLQKSRTPAFAMRKLAAPTSIPPLRVLAPTVPTLGALCRDFGISFHGIFSGVRSTDQSASTGSNAVVGGVGLTYYMPSVGGTPEPMPASKLSRIFCRVSGPRWLTRNRA